jgi:amino acid transporter
MPSDSPPPSDDPAADLERRITQPGSLPGNRYVVVRREDLGSFRRGRGGMLVATERADEPPSGAARLTYRLKRAVIGRPLPTSAVEAERLPVRRALPTLASDALSSVAYGPEAGLTVLALAGVGAFAFELPIALAIAALMVLVTLSYRQLVLTRQTDGGSYAAARDHLGRWPAMVAAAALLIDYVLTVSVSVSSGADALASAFPVLNDLRLPIAVLLALILCAGNLRGVREAGAMFSTPTFLFIGAMGALIVVGVIRALTGGVHHGFGVYPPIPHPTEALTPFLVLTAFASGCSSMTGIEAVSNSVRSFREPQGRNAARTLSLLGLLLVILFLGVTLLDLIFGAAPKPGGSPTVLAQIAQDVFTGPGRFFFYVIQFSTMLVLVLAANASFNGFPRLCAFLARDDRLPHRFGAYGDRLVYSAAILVLTAVSVAVIVAFAANTDHLINLYAIGVFTAFTLAQTALVRYGLRRRQGHWRRNVAINAVGAAATLLVDLIVLVVKFRLGAWVVLIIVPLVVAYFWYVSRHYLRVRSELGPVAADRARLRPDRTLVPVRQLDGPTRRALKYALALGPRLIALAMSEGPDFESQLRAYLHDQAKVRPTAEYEVVSRPGSNRSVLSYLTELAPSLPDHLVTVMVPESVTSSGILDLLRRPSALRLKFALLRRPGVVAASFPGHPGQDSAEDALRPGARRVAVVPVAGLDILAQRALNYAQHIADEVIAVHVATGQPQDVPRADGTQRRDDLGMEPSDEARELVAQWDAWVDSHLESSTPLPRPKLILVLSPFRTVVQPVLRYLQGFGEKNRDTLCTVVLPELVARHWWNQILHNHRAFHIKSALLGRADFAVADVTFDLSRPPES